MTARGCISKQKNKIKSKKKYLFPPFPTSAHHSVCSRYANELFPREMKREWDPLPALQPLYRTHQTCKIQDFPPRERPDACAAVGGRWVTASAEPLEHPRGPAARGSEPAPGEPFAWRPSSRKLGLDGCGAGKQLSPGDTSSLSVF